MTSSVVGLKRSSKALPKPNLCQEKKVIITIWWLAACLIYYNILNLSETLHLRSRLSNLMSCTENHKAIFKSTVGTFKITVLILKKGIDLFAYFLFKQALFYDTIFLHNVPPRYTLYTCKL